MKSLVRRYYDVVTLVIPIDGTTIAKRIIIFIAKRIKIFLRPGIVSPSITVYCFLIFLELSTLLLKLSFLWGFRDRDTLSLREGIVISSNEPLHIITIELHVQVSSFDHIIIFRVSFSILQCSC